MPAQQQLDLLAALDPILADGYPASAVRVMLASWDVVPPASDIAYYVLCDDHPEIVMRVFRHGAHRVSAYIHSAHARQWLDQGHYRTYTGPLAPWNGGPDA